MNKLVGRVVAPLLAGALALTAACSGKTATVDGGNNAKSISIALVAGWDEDIAATYVWKEILEGRGYSVEVDELDIASTFTAVANGQVDLYMDAWLPTTHESYWSKLGDKLDVVATWYKPADLLLAVPNYVSDVNTIADLDGKAGQFGKQIVGIESGSGLMRVTKEKVIPMYGLTDYDLRESSTAAMLATLGKKVEAKEPVVVTLWRPHWAFAKLPLKVLEDPKGAYGRPDQVQIVSPKGWSTANGEVAGWLKKFSMTSDQLGTLELLIQAKGKGKEQEAAKEWIKSNQSVVDTWLA